jgi:hypothetical protein
MPLVYYENLGTGSRPWLGPFCDDGRVTESTEAERERSLAAECEMAIRLKIEEAARKAQAAQEEARAQVLTAEAERERLIAVEAELERLLVAGREMVTRLKIEAATSKAQAAQEEARTQVLTGLISRLGEIEAEAARIRKALADATAAVPGANEPGEPGLPGGPATDGQEQRLYDPTGIGSLTGQAQPRPDEAARMDPGA